VVIGAFQSRAALLSSPLPPVSLSLNTVLPGCQPPAMVTPGLNPLLAKYWKNP